MTPWNWPSKLKYEPRRALGEYWLPGSFSTCIMTAYTTFQPFTFSVVLRKIGKKPLYLKIHMKLP